jgi:prolipoprotein diacylglyceryltransferase
MIGDLLIIGIMALIFIKLWQTKPGVTFFTGVVLYSAMRFGVSYLRIDSGTGCPNSVGCPEYIIRDWMTFPQVVSMITFAVGLAGLLWCAISPREEAPAAASTEAAKAQTPAPARQT